jgi:hypothetical protein
MKILDREGAIKERVPITDLAFRRLFDVMLQDSQNDCEKNRCGGNTVRHNIC